MDIKVIRTKTSGSVENHIHMITVDQETLIEVFGLGSSEGKIRVSNMDADNKEYNPTGTIKDLLDKSPDDDEKFNIIDIGTCLVWATPYTVAHAVMDMINNA